MYKALYLHGFRSSGQSATFRHLQRRYSHDFEWLSIDIDYGQNPIFTIRQVGQFVAQKRIDVVVGTSMGGWLTDQLPSGPLKVVVNPVETPYDSIKRQYDEWIAEHPRAITAELPIFGRKDKVCRVTPKLLEQYAKLPLPISEIRDPNWYGFFSTHDETLHRTEADNLAILEAANANIGPGHVILTDAIGHRCTPEFADTELMPLILEHLK